MLRSRLAMIVTRGPKLEVQLANNKFIEPFGYTMEDVIDEASSWPLAYPDNEYREAIKSEWPRRINGAELQKEDIEPITATSLQR